ncbi:MAG: hypothetical protein L6R38_007621 [Xanthoria sp. 2 TBL-2021]|nr:MAG: hypothetical protein L6R38_007621 [Xanthoria sp. 2 TBL-2021]
MKSLSFALVSVGSLAAVAATPVPQVKVQVWKDAGMRGASAIISSKIGECIHLDRVAWEDTVSSIKVDSPFKCRVYE